MSEDLHSVEADDRLLLLLEQVAAEGELTITRDGQAVAKLVTLAPARQELLADRQAKTRAAMEGLRRLREEIRQRGGLATIDEILEWRDEGRR